MQPDLSNDNNHSRLSWERFKKWEAFESAYREAKIGKTEDGLWVAFNAGYIAAYGKYVLKDGGTPAQGVDPDHEVLKQIVKERGLRASIGPAK